MKLTDLEPSWIRTGPNRSGMGITFECPVHPGGACHQGVWFANPIDGGPAHVGDQYDNGKRWRRTGDTFETLTLHPSIRVRTQKMNNEGGIVDAAGKPVMEEHWHGHVLNGMVT